MIPYSGYFPWGGLIFAFVMEGICENYAGENLPHMCVCVQSAGAHLCCTNKFCNTKIYHRKKYPLYSTLKTTCKFTLLHNVFYIPSTTIGSEPLLSLPVM